MKKLNIAQMHWGFPPIIGGVETHLAIMLPEFVKRGHNVSLLTGSVEGSAAKEKYRGVTVHRTPLFDLNWLVKRGLHALDEEITKTYIDFLEASKPDIIHVHNMHYFSEPHIKILEALAGRKDIPLVLTAHNVWDDFLFLKLTRDINWSHIISVSHYIKKEIMGAGFDEERVSVIHHGIDTKVFHPGVSTSRVLKKFPQLKGRRIIFHPARMGMAKGCDVSIKAMRIVKERFPDALMVMAGNKNIIDWELSQEKDIAYFVELIKTFGLIDNVFINYYSLKEMPALYGLSEICIYPSTASEPFGLTMLESLATAKPMIVTNMGGMPEIVMNDINGYVINVKDYEALASKIDHLLSEPRVSKRLGTTGRKNVCTHYTKGLMTKAHLDTYRDLLKGQKPEKEREKALPEAAVF